MIRQEFKEKWLDDSFHWVDEFNFEKLQEILQSFGFKCHTGNGTIGWHDGFKNIQTFKPDEWHNFEYYQKSDFWHRDASYGEAKDYEKMIEDLSLVE